MGTLGPHGLRRVQAAGSGVACRETGRTGGSGRSFEVVLFAVTVVVCLSTLMSTLLILGGQ